MARTDPSQGNAVVDARCPECGLNWLQHKGAIPMCRELNAARQQLVDLRVTFFVLCLKYLPEGMEFTPDNLLTVMLKKKPKNYGKQRTH